MRFKIALAAIALLGAGLSTTAGAQCTFFSNRSAWEAAATGLTNITFEENGPGGFTDHRPLAQTPLRQFRPGTSPLWEAFPLTQPQAPPPPGPVSSFPARHPFPPAANKPHSPHANRKGRGEMSCP